MDKFSPENYKVEDFISNESFINYHFNSNKNDRLFWEQWVINHPGKQHLVKEAKEMLETLSLTISEKEYQEELNKITAVINEKKKQKPIARSTAGNKLWQLYQRKKRTMQYVLPLLLIVFAGVYWLIRFSQNRPVRLIETANNGSVPIFVTLSDSTLVTLAPHSSLRYPLYFADKERNVYLHGNARFTVTRNVQHPFKVYAENIVATVLGTVFNITTSADSAIEVELLKGKLNVEIMNSRMEPEQSVLLNADERAVYLKNDRRLYKSQFIPENRVYFRQNNFDEIARQIKDVFGITVINESNNKSWRFTGEFKNSTAKDIIENICLVKKLSLVEKGDTIYIK